MVEALAAVAGQVKTEAEHMMPRGSDERRGHMADKFYIGTEGQQVFVSNADRWFYHLAEFGSANNPPYAPLRRGARAAGCRLVEEPKP